ncbi:hypothetical protein OIU78_024317 [Salix suchowensis]|nr:hypothetical protein OIU78_024317 [Salix suchowensis]
MSFSPSSSSSSSVQTLLKSGFSPTLKSINQFLQFLSKSHKYELISHFFSQINRHEIKCNPQTHSIFTWALLKLDKFEEAENFMKTQMEKSSKSFRIWRLGFFNSRMEKEGLAFDVVFYSNWICGYYREGMLMEALQKHGEMVEKGINLDMVSYTVLVDGFSKEGNVEKAVGFLHKMIENGSRPNLVTYTSIVLGFCQKGKMDEAFAAFKMVEDMGMEKEENGAGILEIKRRWEEAGVCMDIVMCNILIKALFMVGAFEDVYALYKGMKEMDLVADSVTYCTLIDGYCKSSRIDEALEIFDEFRKTLASSVACYNCMINGLCKNGMVDVATEVFIELSEKGLTFDVGIYMTLIKAIAKAESMEGVLNLIYRLENLGVDMYDTICNDTISFLCKQKCPLAATEVYMVLRKNQLLVTCKSYYSILKGLIDDGKIWLSQLLIGSFMKDYGIAEPKLSNILLCYLSLKDINSALCFLSKMKDNDSSVTFPVCALKVLMKTGRFLAAYELVMGV